MGVEFNINLNAAGKGGGAGADKQPPWALDPATDKALTPQYLAAQQKHTINQFKSFGGQAGSALGSWLGSAGGPGAAYAGGQLGQLAGTGAGQMAAQALGPAFGGAAAAIVPYLAPLATAAVAAGVAIKAFTASVEYFVERGKELAPYSGAISSARAMANVRQIQGDIREAGQLGDSIARLTDAQSRFNDDIRRLLEPIRRVVAEILASLMEKLANILDEVTPEVTASMEEIIGLLKSLYEALVNFDFTKAAEEWHKAQDRAEKARKFSGNKLDFMSHFLFGAGGLERLADQPRDPMATQASQVVNAPRFGGV